nr:TetR/AcrR family transcriptional regulator [Kibdelosporangium phytohabitans]
MVGAAAELFDRVGFVRATMAEISSAAGVTKGALYFHFPSKDTLADAVRAEAIEMLDILVARLPAGLSPMQAVIDMHHHVVRWLREDAIVRASLRISHDTGDPADFCASWLAATERLLRRASPERAELAATALVGLCLGVETLRWNGIRRDGRPEPWELVLPSLVGHDPSGTNRLSRRGGTIDGRT